MAIIYNGSPISWTFILYVILAIAIGINLVKYFFTKGQQITAISLLVLLFFVFLFYQLRWFTNFQLKGTASASVPTPAAGSSCGSSTASVGAPSSWPPIVNMCPDFMVTWKDDNANIYCYDNSNLYNLSTSSPNITSITIPGVGNKPAYLVKNGSVSGNSQSLNDSGASAKWPFLAALLSGGIPLSDPSMKYLRWEGVWDGFKLNVANAPLP